MNKLITLGIMLLFLGMTISSSTEIIVSNDDTTPPVTTCTLVPAEPNGLNGWYVRDVEVTLSAWDDISGVKAIYYRIPGDEWKNHTGYFLIFILDHDCLDGWIEFYSVDYAGNHEVAKSIRIKIDQLPPQVEIEIKTFKVGGEWYVRFASIAKDACSGSDRGEMYINDGLHEVIVGSGPIYEFTIEWSHTFKSCVFKFVFYDVAGNSATVLVNGSDIKPYFNSQSSSRYSQNMWFLHWLESFPFLQRLLGWFAW